MSMLSKGEVIERLKYAEKKCINGYYYILIRPDVRDRIIELLNPPKKDVMWELDNYNLDNE